jgi:hypothetical protein
LGQGFNRKSHIGLVQIHGEVEEVVNFQYVIHSL